MILLLIFNLYEYSFTKWMLLGRPGVRWGQRPLCPFFFSPGGVTQGVAPKAFNERAAGGRQGGGCCLFGCRLVPGLRRCSVDPGAADSSRGYGPKLNPPRSTRPLDDPPPLFPFFCLGQCRATAFSNLG